MIMSLARKFLPRSFRNWCRSPFKSVKYMGDRIKFSGGMHSRVSPAKGFVLSCHPAAVHFFDIFRTDPVQAEELKSFVEHCSPGMRFLDIGAHYGLFALACEHYSGNSARILCVEASSRAVDILKSNLKLNKAEHNVDVLNCAMGGDDGYLDMLSTGPLGADYFVHPTEPRPDTIKIPQLTLESILNKTGFQPTHIKMDIESYEYEVISSSLSCLRAFLPVMFLEIHGSMLKKRGKDPAEIVTMLRNVGYLLWSPEGQLLNDDFLKCCGYDCRVIAKKCS